MAPSSGSAVLRRRATQAQLEETNEIASLLASRDDAPMRPVHVVDVDVDGGDGDGDGDGGFSRFAPPRSAEDSERLSSLITMMMMMMKHAPSDGPRKQDEETNDRSASIEKLKDAMSSHRTCLRMILSSTAADGGGGGGGGGEEEHEHRASSRWMTSGSTRIRKDEPTNDSMRETPLALHLAAKWGKTAAVEAILHEDPDTIDLANSWGESALHIAVGYGHLETVRVLCSRVPHACRYQDNGGNLPLHLANRCGGIGIGTGGGGGGGAAGTDGMPNGEDATETAEVRRHRLPLITSALMAAYPRGILTRNDAGELPIHLAAQFAFTAGIRGLLAAHGARGLLERIDTTTRDDDDDHDDNNDDDDDEKEEGSSPVGGARRRYRHRRQRRRPPRPSTHLLPVDLAILGHRCVVERVEELRRTTTPATKGTTTTTASQDEVKKEKKNDRSNENRDSDDARGGQESCSRRRGGRCAGARKATAATVGRLGEGRPDEEELRSVRGQVAVTARRLHDDDDDDCHRERSAEHELMEFLRNETDEATLLIRKQHYEECIELLLISSLYQRAVFSPREGGHLLEDETDAPFFLPLHAALVARLERDSWNHLFGTMYGNRHCRDVDREGRNLLHACAEACLLGVADLSTTTTTGATPALASSSAPSAGPNSTPSPGGQDMTRTSGDGGSGGHCHAFFEDQLVEMISDIHQRNPTAHASRDHYGLVPLQLALLNGATPKVVKALVDCGPQMISAKWVAYERI